VTCSLDHTKLKTPLCQECKSILPFHAGLTHFEIFGFSPPRFHLDLKALDDKFFELSRILHPDKFATQGPEKLLASTQWFAALSTAYSILKDPEDRAQAIFNAVGFKPQTTQKQVPADLAEDYFELKELVMEAEDKAPLLEFQQKIDSLIKECDQSLSQTFQKWEKTKDEKELESGANTLNRRSYLMSMRSDLERTCQRLSAST